MKNIFISLEGLSAVGKTTIGEILSGELAGVFYKTPPSLFCETRDKMDKKIDITSRFLFYLSGVVQSSREIEKIIKTKSIICDRYIHTTMCYHSAMGINTQLIEKWVFDNILIPDYTFLIICKENIRQERLEKRGLTYNDLVERNSGIKTMYLKNFREYNLIEIDNSQNGPEFAVQKILSMVKRQ